VPHKTEALSIHASCGEFAVPARAWQLMLILADRYGWETRGTKPPDELAIDAGLWRANSDWDGRYLPAYGQQVTEQDARDLAAALERALPDIPDHEALESKGDDNSNVWGWFETSPNIEVNPFEAFSGRNKELLKNFIEHCHEEGGLWLY
jgi:hypothetical protein